MVLLPRTFSMNPCSPTWWWNEIWRTVFDESSLYNVVMEWNLNTLWVPTFKSASMLLPKFVDSHSRFLLTLRRARMNVTGSVWVRRLWSEVPHAPLIGDLLCQTSSDLCACAQHLWPPAKWLRGAVPIGKSPLGDGDPVAGSWEFAGELLTTMTHQMVVNKPSMSTSPSSEQLDPAKLDLDTVNNYMKEHFHLSA